MTRPQGDNLNKLGRSPLGDATYQISRLQDLWFQTRRFFQCIFLLLRVLHSPPPTGVTSRLCFSDSITFNELFATCWPSGVGDVWVLQRVEYVTPHFLEKQKYKIKAIKELFELFKLAKQSCNM